MGILLFSFKKKCGNLTKCCGGNEDCLAQKHRKPPFGWFQANLTGVTSYLSGLASASCLCGLCF